MNGHDSRISGHDGRMASQEKKVVLRIKPIERVGS
jgi:hypothetical protein